MLKIVKKQMTTLSFVDKMKTVTYKLNVIYLKSNQVEY